MYSFRNDYTEGAHPNILNKLIETNYSQQPAYGDDEFSIAAKKLLKEKLNNPQASIYFISGGTQTNMLVISSLLRPHEAVISAKSGHIFSHEAGAIEATGHRVITIETSNGKLNPQMLQSTLNEYTLRPHVVKPKMVYVSNSTEVGSIYKKTELEQLYQFCKANNLYLYLDGARLGHALTSTQNDIAFNELTHLCDAFYIGGTKNGALVGEALVFNNQSLAPEFDYALKQRGALLAKGRLLGIQFLELFTNNLYFTLAKHANTMAAQMAEAIKQKGYSFVSEPVTNQLFPVLPKTLINELSKKYIFYQWKEIDEQHAALRLITSWATRKDAVDEFINDIKNNTHE